MYACMCVCVCISTVSALRCVAGEGAEEIFSSPKVQIMRITDKYLTDAPMAPTEVIFRELPQVVGAVCCFAGFLCADGTSAEAAERLRADAARAAAAERRREAAECEAKRARAAARAELRALGAVITEDNGSDLEDDIDDGGNEVKREGDAGEAATGEASGDEEDAKAGAMLSCVSLAKVVDVFVQCQPDAPEAKALESLMKFDAAANSGRKDRDAAAASVNIPTVHMPQVCLHSACAIVGAGRHEREACWWLRWQCHTDSVQDSLCTGSAPVPTWLPQCECSARWSVLHGVQHKADAVVCVLHVPCRRPAETRAHRDSESPALQEAMEACLIRAHQQLQAEAQRRQAIQHDLRFLRDSEALKQWERRRTAAAGTVQSLQADLAKLEARLQKLRAQAQRAAVHAVKPEPEADAGAHPSTAARSLAAAVQRMHATASQAASSTVRVQVTERRWCRWTL